jgi:hypothetical protein
MRLKHFATLFLLIFTAACSRSSSNEEALRGRVEEMKIAIENKDASGFMKHVAPTFKGASDETGEMDREALRRLVTGTLFVYPKIKVATTVREIKVTDESAQMLIEAIATAGENVLPDQARHFSFDAQWSRTGQTWQLTRAKWGK